jgi:hypothetical protein
MITMSWRALSLLLLAAPSALADRDDRRHGRVGR